MNNVLLLWPVFLALYLNAMVSGEGAKKRPNTAEKNPPADGIRHHNAVQAHLSYNNW